MIGSLGLPEIIFILVLALLIFGPRKLPEIGKTLGRALGEFRRATTDLKRTFDDELSSEEFRNPMAKPAPSKPVSREITALPVAKESPVAEEAPVAADDADAESGTEPTPSSKAE